METHGGQYGCQTRGGLSNVLHLVALEVKGSVLVLRTSLSS